MTEIVYSFKTINDFAEKISKDHHLTDFSNGDNLYKFVETIGGAIVSNHEYDWIVNRHKSLQVRGPNDFTVHFNKYTGPLRDRFSLAHDLGHYFIHSKQGEIKLERARRSPEGIAEFQANWFACGLLMPSDEFVEVYNTTQDKYSIAGRFMVPIKAVDIRIKNLIKYGKIS